MADAGGTASTAGVCACPAEAMAVKTGNTSAKSMKRAAEYVMACDPLAKVRCILNKAPHSGFFAVHSHDTEREM
jgi:hypothetical protein